MIWIHEEKPENNISFTYHYNLVNDNDSHFKVPCSRISNQVSSLCTCVCVCVCVCMRA